MSTREPRLRKKHHETTAFVRLALDAQFGLVTRNNMLDDGQTEPRTARFARTPLIHPEKTFGQTGEIVFINPDAVIRHGKLRPVMHPLPGNADFTIRRGVPHRIAGEIGESRMQFLLASEHDISLVVRIKLDLDTVTA